MQESLDSRNVRTVRQLRHARSIELDCDTTRTNTPSDPRRDLEDVVRTHLQEVLEQFEISASELVQLLQPKLKENWTKCSLQHIARELLTERKIQSAAASLSAKIAERMARLQASLKEP
mmetsp:Transcript_971/g.2376  ORF Transcript_971/g.2376 Transcript_971/m.2376 type:complete len:119 (-) Transcript_971:1156-1512(-)